MGPAGSTEQAVVAVAARDMIQGTARDRARNGRAVGGSARDDRALRLVGRNDTADGGTPGPAAAPPLTVFDLSMAEQLLLWSARRWRHGRFRWQEVEGEFRCRLGTGWADALLPWDMALDLLHRLPLGQPEIRNGCETILGCDEVALIRLIALAQVAGRADTSLLLARLARPQDRAELSEWVALIAAALPPLPLRA